MSRRLFVVCVGVWTNRIDDLIHKARATCGDATLANGGPRKPQLLTCPRQGDITQAALFLDAGGIGQRALVGQRAFFKPRRKHDRPFEPLGGMDGQQLHRIAAVVFAVQRRHQAIRAARILVGVGKPPPKRPMIVR